MEKFKKVLKLFLIMFKIGLFTFGGGYAMIAVLEREFVERQKWLTDEEFLNIAGIAESTPGPIAINSATYIGYKIAGFFGSLFATLGVVLPSLIIVSVIYVFFDLFKGNKWFNAAFRGIRSAVIVLLFNAVLKLFKIMERNPFTIVATCIVFLVTLFTDFNSIYLILIGGVLGIIYFVVKAKRAKQFVEEGNGNEEKPPKSHKNGDNSQGESQGGGEE